MSKRALILLSAVVTLAGCGTPTLDLAGYPDKTRDALYAQGRAGGDKGLASFDLRKVWQDL